MPYCTVDEFGANKLGLWWLKSMDELVVGKWNILEPPRDRWGDPEQGDFVRAARYRDRARRGLQPRRRPDGKRPGLLRPASRIACDPIARLSLSVTNASCSTI